MEGKPIRITRVDVIFTLEDANWPDPWAAQVAELRAVLAPLLDDPGRDGDNWGVCRFCGTWLEHDPHKADCPAEPTNRDRLLGR